MTGNAAIVVLGAANGPRADGFARALEKLGRPPAIFISYDAFIETPGRLADSLRPGTVLRFESPDRDTAALAALYGRGAEGCGHHGYKPLTGSALASILAAKGPIGSPAQLAFGLARTLGEAAAIARSQGARLLAEPDDLAATFDKTLSAERLEAAAVPVPPRLPAVGGMDDLMARMAGARLRRVFVKLRYGSSAAGMTALALGPAGRMIAYTTAIFGERGELCATRAVRRLDRAGEIARLIDALAPLGLHVEAWLPKTGIAGSSADLRMIAVDGRPVFNVMRLGRHPMTNLHLGGRRASPEPLRQRVGDAAWTAMLESCAAAARAFPSCFMIGIDAAILTGDRTHTVFEVNAFGDHVKGASYEGCSPQEWQILHYGRFAEAA